MYRGFIAMTETVSTPASFDSTLDNSEVTYNFRSAEDKDTKIKTKRSAITLKIKHPSVEGAGIIYNQGGKGLELMIELMKDAVEQRARDILTDNPDMTEANFPYDQLSWEAISNLEKEDRRSGISKEAWEAWVVDYTEVMSALGTDKKAANAQADVMVGRFAKIKTNKVLIGKLVQRLSMYYENTPNSQEYAEIVDTLMKRADKLITAEEVSLDDALGLGGAL